MIFRNGPNDLCQFIYPEKDQKNGISDTIRRIYIVTKRKVSIELG